MDPHSDELCHWLTLCHTPCVGPLTCRALLQRFSSPRHILAADGETLRAAGIRQRTIEALARGPDRAAVDRDLAWATQAGCHIITLHDPRYPALLEEIADPPPLLYVRGEPALLARPQLAIVGSRNPSPAGRENAVAFAAGLSRLGLLVTSGMALGIDGAAHEGALEADAPTLAVAGTGLDQVYPPAHRGLARRILERGALVSELPPDTAPRPEHFPRRNRIISGLGLGVLVVEAAPRSGSLITARLALEQGREVFAIPGSIHNPLARGCHALIRAGAKLVECLEDIVEELGWLKRPLSAGTPPPGGSEPPPAQDMDGDSLRLLAQMGHDPVSFDTLVARSGLTAARLSSMLLAMELNDLITSLPGGLYLRRTQRTPR